MEEATKVDRSYQPGPLGNTEAGFVLASVTEFLHLWRSGKKSSLLLECKEGKTFVSFKCGLGKPDQHHIQDVRRRRKKKKSSKRILRDKARAASYQATQATAAAPPPPASPPAGENRSPPAQSSAGRDKSPPQSHQPTPPSSSQQPLPRHTSPLPYLPSSMSILLASSLPSSSPEEPSQAKKAEGVGTKSGIKSVRFSEEAEEMETELTPLGTENITEEEVISSQCPPSLHQGREERETEDDGLPPARFWWSQLDHQRQLDRRKKSHHDEVGRRQQQRQADLRELRGNQQQEKPDSCSKLGTDKPDQLPNEDHPPPLRRK